jgi:hypothetical protein
VHEDVEVGFYTLNDNTIFSIKVYKPYQKQGHATRTIAKLYNDGTISGPSEDIMSRYVLRIWNKLGHYPDVSEDVLAIGDMAQSDDF